ncbi:unnamed protein product [Sphagnum tenellum]
MPLTREHPDYVRALPSLTPPTPSEIPLELRIDGLPNRSCLRTSSELVGSDLISPGLTFNQAPTMFFHIEHLSLLSLDGGRFVPVDFGSGRVAKYLKDLLRLVQVRRGALQVESCVIGEGLVPDQTAFGKGEAFDPMVGVGQHVLKDIGSENE